MRPCFPVLFSMEQARTVNLCATVARETFETRTIEMLRDFELYNERVVLWVGNVFKIKISKLWDSYCVQFIFCHFESW